MTGLLLIVLMVAAWVALRWDTRRQARGLARTLEWMDAIGRPDPTTDQHRAFPG